MSNNTPMQPGEDSQETPLQAKMREHLWRVQQLRDVHAVQGTDGNWNVDRYMRGMFNGMELALAILESREVSYKEPPANGYTHEPDNPDFSTALKTLLNWHSWDSAVGMPDFLLSDMLVHILQGMEVAHDKQQELQPAPMAMSPEGSVEDMAAAEAYRAKYKPGEVVEYKAGQTPPTAYTDLGPGNTI